MSATSEVASVGFAIEQGPMRRENRPLPKKVAALAGFLLLIGIGFGFAGLGVALTHSVHDAMPYLIIGGIGLIPGVYHSVILYRAWAGHRGYTYDLIPQFQ